MTKMTVKVEYELDESRIADLLCTAFEGGSNYWIESLVISREPAGGLDGVEYMSDVPGAGGALKISAFECEWDESTPELDLELCREGLRRLAEKYPHRMHQILEEQDDAEAADMFLQCALFGDVIFG